MFKYFVYDNETTVMVNFESNPIQFMIKNELGTISYSSIFIKSGEIVYDNGREIGEPFNKARMFAIKVILEDLCLKIGIDVPKPYVKKKDPETVYLKFKNKADHALFYFHYHNKLRELY